MPAWCTPWNGMNARSSAGPSTGVVGGAPDGEARGAGGQAAGARQERAPRDASGRRHDRPSAPGTRARFSDRPPSWALSLLICTGVTVGFGQRGDGNSSSCGQKSTQP